MHTCIVTQSHICLLPCPRPHTYAPPHTPLCMQDPSSLEALQLVADLVKRLKCVCPAEVVRCLMPLRFSQVQRTADGKIGVGGWG